MIRAVYKVSVVQDLSS